MTATATTSASSREPARRAGWATAVFACGALVSLSHVGAAPVALPLTITYAVLLVNTFHSIRCFARHAPRSDAAQRCVDAVLAGLYLVMAAALGDVHRFLSAALLMFAVATFKYTLLLGTGRAPELLARKLRIDAIGTLFCAAVLVGMPRGDGLLTAWGLTIVSVAVNVHLLWLHPMYATTPPAAFPPRAASVLDDRFGLDLDEHARVDEA